MELKEIKKRIVDEFIKEFRIEPLQFDQETNKAIAWWAQKLEEAFQVGEKSGAEKAKQNDRLTEEALARAESNARWGV